MLAVKNQDTIKTIEPIFLTKIIKTCTDKSNQGRFYCLKKEKNSSFSHFRKISMTLKHQCLKNVVCKDLSMLIMIYSKNADESLDECRRMQMSHRRMQTSHQTNVDESLDELLGEYRRMQTSVDESIFFSFFPEKVTHGRNFLLL